VKAKQLRSDPQTTAQAKNEILELARTTGSHGITRSDTAVFLFGPNGRLDTLPALWFLAELVKEHKLRRTGRRYVIEGIDTIEGASLVRENPRWGTGQGRRSIPGVGGTPVNELEKQFHNAMINIYRQAKSECNYSAGYFIQMVNEEGGLRAAKILLRKSDASEGFAALWERGRLDLTVEALVLRDPWCTLFDDDELKTARMRLGDLNYTSPSKTKRPNRRTPSQPTMISSLASPSKDESHSDAGLTLEKLERAIRRFVEAKLRTMTANWWIERVPADVRHRAEERQRRDETLWPWLSPKTALVSEFLDFSDYKKIIAAEENWEQVFREQLVNREIVVAKLLELEPIRNTIAHHRELSAEQLEVVRINAKHLMTLLKA